MTDILDRLADLDEETMIHDPQTDEGRRELDRIRGEMEELEAELAEMAHWDYLTDFAGF